MWFFSPQIVKIIANITLIGLGFLSVPVPPLLLIEMPGAFLRKKLMQAISLSAILIFKLIVLSIQLPEQSRSILNMPFLPSKS